MLNKRERKNKCTVNEFITHCLYNNVNIAQYFNA